MSKSKYPQFTTGAGIASYPYLNKPDTRFDEVYKVDLVVPTEKAKSLIKQVDDYLKSFVKDIQEQTGKKQNLKNYRVPYEDNDDGTVTFKIKQRTVINDDPITLTFFDSKGQRVAQPPMIFGGSTVKVSGSMRGYISGVNRGVTLGMYAIQIIELCQRQERSADSFGFGADENGYCFNDEESSPDNDNDLHSETPNDEPFDF